MSTNQFGASGDRADTLACPMLLGSGATTLLRSAQRIVITGAGGWIGLATLEMLHGLLGNELADRVCCFGRRDRVLYLRSGAQFEQRSIESLSDLGSAPTILLHLGFLTQHVGMTLTSQEFVSANRAISKIVVGALERIGAERVFLASSGAAYAPDANGGPLTKGLYGSLKLEDEDRVLEWQARTGGTAAIGRVFNLAGPYINKRTTYALASFITDALADRPIEIRATGLVYRSYVAIQELIGVVLGVLTGPTGVSVRFDTAGEAPVEMADIANEVASVLGHHKGVLRAPIDASKALDWYVGDPATFIELGKLSGVPRVPMPEQVRQTAQFIAALPE